MIQSIHVTNASGDTLDLELWNVAQGAALGGDRLRIFNIEGLGSPKATVSGLSGPIYDGVTGYFIRADARHILMTLVIPRRGDYEELARRAIYEYFPGKGEIKFRVVTDTRDVYTMATVESVEMNHFSSSVNAVISLYCAYPYFLDVSGIFYYAEFDGTSQAVINDSEYATGGYFTLIFGVENADFLILENSRESQTFTLHYTYVPGGAVGPGEKIYIDTRDNQRRVIHESANGVTQIDITDGVEKGSDWLQLYPGTNWISLTLDTEEARPADCPDPTYLTTYLPLNEGQDEDPKELAYNTDMDIMPSLASVPVARDEGIMYPHARLFDEAEEAYFQANISTRWCPAADFTFIFWARLEEITADPSTQKHYILSVEDGPTDGWRVWFWKTPSLGVLKFDLLCSSVWKSLSRNYTATDTWSCFILSFDERNEEMYIRWMPYTVGTLTGVAGPAPYSSQLKIGGGVAGEKYWPGYLQGMALYNGLLLDSAEQTWVYNDGKGRTFAELTGTVEVLIDYKYEHAGV